ncbi:hypothetical protein [Clavibacter zhangzhiyongii]|uniref:hypothetical protein n=1 Tax=Clavibacter zhangzhiyongii TaxID=2768071 RepID=UPI0039DF5220
MKPMRVRSRIAPVKRRMALVGRGVEVVDGAREAGVPVVHVPDALDGLLQVATPREPVRRDELVGGEVGHPGPVHAGDRGVAGEQHDVLAAGDVPVQRRVVDAQAVREGGEGEGAEADLEGGLRDEPP